MLHNRRSVSALATLMMPALASPACSANDNAPESEPRTVRDPRPALDSHVRLRAVAPEATDDARAAIDQMGDEQLALTTAMICLDQQLETEVDPRAARAFAELRERAADVHELREALAAMYVLATDRALEPAFAADAPLVDYVRGVYAWAHAAVRALTDLAYGLRQGRPDWALCRYRLAEARHFHLEELQGDVRADVCALRLVGAGADRASELDERVEELFACAMWAEMRLDARFD